MTVEVALRTLALADATLAGLIGDRMYPLRMPQNPTYPLMTYTIVAEDPNEHLDGPAGDSEVLVQFDSYALTYAQSRSIDELLRLAINGYRGTVASVAIQRVSRGGRLTTNEAEVGHFRTTSDYRIVYEES